MVRKLGLLDTLRKGHPLNAEGITLTLFLIIVANFVLGIVIGAPFLNITISTNMQQLLLLAYFFIFYILFLAGAAYYSKRFYKRNEIKILVWGLIIGLVVIGFLSYRFIGISDTLQWAIPTGATLIVAYIFYKLSKGKTTPF